MPELPDRGRPDPEFARHWLLDPAIAFLNHGSFGACPTGVLHAQQALRSRIEQQPVQFFARDLEPLLDAARDSLAQFVGAAPTDLVFVPNATTGINTVLRSLCDPAHPDRLRPGDELLTTDHEYNASRNSLEFAAAWSGAKVVVVPMPFPIARAEQAIGAVLDHLSPRTRLVLLDHVTSQTGLVLPIAPLVQACRARGIATLIDGAHAPGMVALDLQSLGATYYTGNCHKWLCAPKGAAFLYAQSDQHRWLRPLIISHGANSPRHDRSRFWLEFDWTGTADFTPYLCVPTAIAAIAALLPGGWPEIYQRNRTLALRARDYLCQVWDIPAPAPDDLVGAMVSLPLPSRLPADVYDRLWQDFKIEVPIIPWQAPYPRLIRLSAQLYNRLSQYEYLADVLGQCS
ncbi:aminotransferase class V-fold PLP-dependent enzyme [Trichothermofontia sp.]